MKNLKYLLIASIIIISAGSTIAQDTTYNWVVSPTETGIIPDNNVDPIPPAPGVPGDTAFLTIKVAGLPNRIDPLAFIQTAFDITHTAIGDLELYLKSPKGTELILVKAVGANGDTNFTGTVISQDADAAFFPDGIAPYTGKWFPTEMPPGLAKFNGENPNGIWTLRIFDKGLGDNGVLNSWSLTFSTAPLNSLPVAVNDEATTNEDVSKEIDVTFNDTDSDGSIDKTKVTTIRNPKKGTFTLDTPMGKINYTPALGFFGKDTMSYVVKDNKGATSNEAFIYITVNEVIPNVAPVANNDSVETNKNVPVTIAVTVNDIDTNLDKATVSIKIGPKSGIAQIINGDIKYTPNTNFIGNDTLSYDVKDAGGLVSNTARVTIKVLDGTSNTPPTAVNDTFIQIPAMTIAGADFIIRPLDNDFDTGGSLDVATLTIIRQSTKGTATVNLTNGTINYDPTAEGITFDTITYQVKDNGGMNSNIATIFIQVGTTGVNSLSNGLKSLTVYPNPGTGRIKMNLPESLENKKAAITVYDIKGSMVYFMETNVSKESEIDLSTLPNGIYNLVLNSNKQNYSGKVEILK